jgi:hypothetical protein
MRGLGGQVSGRITKRRETGAGGRETAPKQIIVIYAVTHGRGQGGMIYGACQATKSKQYKKASSGFAACLLETASK